MITVNRAKKLEDAFLGGITEAQDAYEEIVSNEAWTVLGYDTFSEWWTERVHPLMRQLSMFPNRKLAAKVIEQVRADEAELPATQRRTQAELGELVGQSPDADRKRQARSRQADMSAGGDLEEPAPEPVDPLPQPIAEQIQQAVAERVTRPIPPKMTPAERAEHDESVQRAQAIDAAHWAAKSFTSDMLTPIVTIVTGYRLGETGLVTKEQIHKVRDALDMLEKEL